MFYEDEDWANEITEKFYDVQTGDLIEIQDGIVTSVAKSILSKQQRLTINIERAQRLVAQEASNHKETPLVQPEMFATNEEVSYAGGDVLVAPEMTWNEKTEPNYSGQASASSSKNQESGIPIPVMEW